CEDASDECWEEQHIHIILSISTLGCHICEGRTICIANQAKRWLTGVEAILKKNMIKMAERNWPLNHCCLKELADKMCRVKYGTVTKPNGDLVFPESGIGKNWTYQFV
ncbi:hypothetical protein BT96DRAFT_754926, partial [Gymnopus androsaceus JB14]